MNIRTLTPDELHRLGLDGWTAAPAEPVGIGAEPLVALGYAASAEQLSLDGPFDAFDIDATLDAGIDLLVHRHAPTVLRFDCADRLLVMPTPDMEAIDAEDLTAIVVDTRVLSEPVAILHGPHFGVYVLPDGRIGRLEREAVEVRSELMIWYADDEDVWLCDELSARVHSGDPWQHAVALGLAARLRRRASTHARATLDALLAGRPVEDLHRERRWATQQPRDVLDAIEIWAITVAETVVDDLEDLFDRSAPDDPDWQDAITDVLHRRDDVEGIRLLLHEADHGEGLEATLEALDPACRNLIDAVTKWAAPYDERLGRASVASPYGWWISPAVWDAPPLDDEDDA